MPITIVKEKKQRQRSVAVTEAVATLGELLLLKKLSVKVDKGTATLAEKRQFKKLKYLAWYKAERRYAKASVAVQTNGETRRPREQAAHKAWQTRRKLYGESGRDD